MFDYKSLDLILVEFFFKSSVLFNLQLYYGIKYFITFHNISLFVLSIHYYYLIYFVHSFEKYSK